MAGTHSTQPPLSQLPSIEGSSRRDRHSEVAADVGATAGPEQLGSDEISLDRVLRIIAEKIGNESQYLLCTFCFPH